MSSEFLRPSELDEQVVRLFAEIQEAGLAALQGTEAGGDNTLVLEAGASDAFAKGVGVCRIYIDGGPSGCYPGLTRNACQRIADEIIGAQADWDPDGSC
jgi:hypothetical protein